MKRKYQVRWYEYNLTKERSRNFFTAIGAHMFSTWLLVRYDVNAKIYTR